MNMQLQARSVTVRSRVLGGPDTVPILIEAWVPHTTADAAENAAAPPLAAQTQARCAAGAEKYLRPCIRNWPAAEEQFTLDRLRDAIVSAGFTVPQSCVLEVRGEHRPGDPCLQLPLAIAVLRASGQLQVDTLEDCPS